jgi:hypothetical protein
MDWVVDNAAGRTGCEKGESVGKGGRKGTATVSSAVTSPSSATISPSTWDASARRVRNLRNVDVMRETRDARNVFKGLITGEEIGKVLSVVGTTEAAAMDGRSAFSHSG